MKKVFLSNILILLALSINLFADHFGLVLETQKLKGGYSIVYDVYIDKNHFQNQRKTLMKDKKFISVIGEIGVEILKSQKSPNLNNLMHEVSLGEVWYDFNDTFVFNSGDGSGNPRYMRLIEKQTGKTLEDGTFLYANEEKNIVVFQENNKDNELNLTIFDLKTRDKIYLSKEETLELLSEIFRINHISKDVINGIYIPSEVERRKKL